MYIYSLTELPLVYTKCGNLDKLRDLNWKTVGENSVRKQKVRGKIRIKSYGIFCLSVPMKNLSFRGNLYFPGSRWCKYCAYFGENYSYRYSSCDEVLFISRILMAGIFARTSRGVVLSGKWQLCVYFRSRIFSRMHNRRTCSCRQFWINKRVLCWV